METTEECAICLEILERRGGVPIVNPGCGHDLHLQCLVDYQNSGKETCPSCRKEFVIKLGKAAKSQPNTQTATPTPKNQQPHTTVTPPVSQNGWFNVDVWEIPDQFNNHIRHTLCRIYALLKWEVSDPTFSTADYYRLGYRVDGPDFIVINVFNPTIKLSINTNGRQMKVTPKLHSYGTCPNVPREMWGVLREITNWVHSTLHPQRSKGVYQLPQPSSSSSSSVSLTSPLLPTQLPVPRASSVTTIKRIASPVTPSVTPTKRSRTEPLISETPEKKRAVSGRGLIAPHATPTTPSRESKADTWKRAKRIYEKDE
ncbi:hypothetical protein BCR33DRAFT_713893 [Rhizoclosmatium globosum]|uniref:RING-type domain-containing protein n=1 Tax=Rhizoclosmatium globosum TaxID=329046 RepID=A0A1Y2CRB4_9FUNG|nr:hypothetical protein BCR33DRAFT_713893 [Rhizoclosmatium globosum]|eukprot:ORY49578.1 hypothetical protein BCR33DRAFT_713893 [Rhizoclosmatium globosum]